MNKIDFWSLITGFAGIASLILALWDKFPYFKKFLLPLGYILIGFTFGRITFFGERVIFNVASDSQVASHLLLMLFSFLFAFFCFHYFMKKNEVGFAYVSIFIILSTITPSLLQNFSKATEKMNSADYLLLSSIYEEKSDFDTAIKYLNKYLERSSEQKIKEEVRRKLEKLQQKQIDSFK